MAQFNPISDLVLASRAVATSEVARQLRDNPDARMDGDSTAPPVKVGSMDVYTTRISVPFSLPATYTTTRTEVRRVTTGTGDSKSTSLREVRINTRNTISFLDIQKEVMIPNLAFVWYADPVAFAVTQTTDGAFHENGATHVRPIAATDFSVSRNNHSINRFQQNVYFEIFLKNFVERERARNVIGTLSVDLKYFREHAGHASRT